MKFGVSNNESAKPAHSVPGNQEPQQTHEAAGGDDANKPASKGFALAFPSKSSGAPAQPADAGADASDESNVAKPKPLFGGFGKAQPVGGATAGDSNAPAAPRFGANLGGASDQRGSAASPSGGASESPADDAGSDAKPAAGKGFDLSGLAQLDVSDLGETRESAPGDERISQFMDEISADKPEREIPTDADKELVGLLASMDQLYDMVHDPDMMGMALKGFMIELASYPQYRQQIQPADVRLIIQASRRAGATAQVKKSEKKTTRSTGSTKGKVKQNELSALVGSLGFDIGD